MDTPFLSSVNEHFFQGRSGRAAYGELAVGVVKTHPLSGQPVNIGRPADRIAVAAEAHVEIVADHKQNVSFLGRCAGKDRREGNGCAGKGEGFERRPACYAAKDCEHGKVHR